MADPVDYVLYTYQTVDGKRACHAYVSSSQEACETVGASMAQETASTASPIGYMVLGAESLPG